MNWIRYITPNSTGTNRFLVVGFWLIVFYLLWAGLRPDVVPSPWDVAMAFPNLMEQGLPDDTLTSLTTCLEALWWSAIIGLPITYLSRVPLLSPIAKTVGKLRFVGSVAFYLPLLLMLSGGHALKVWLLTLGELFYLVTTMSGVVQNIEEYKYDDTRTLRMSEWKSIWYVNVRGTIPQAIDAIRDNAAMGWNLLMFVEGIVMAEGGLGVELWKMQKHVNYPEMYAICLVILGVGIVQDAFIGLVRKVVCPYAQ